MKTILKRLTAGDFILSAVIIAISMAMMVPNFSEDPGGKAEVYVNNELLETINLSSAGTFIYEGALGDMTVEVKGGAIRISESGCPLQLCVKRGWIRCEGEAAVCLPNRLMVVIKGGGEPSVDEVTGR